MFASAESATTLSSDDVKPFENGQAIVQSESDGYHCVVGIGSISVGPGFGTDAALQVSTPWARHHVDAEWRSIPLPRFEAPLESLRVNRMSNGELQLFNPASGQSITLLAPGYEQLSKQQITGGDPDSAPVGGA